MTSNDPARDQDLLRPDGNTVYGRDRDESAGSGDDSPWESAPSGEKQDAARQPQNAPVPPARGSRPKR
jgi:hypothetical protein